MAFTFDWDSPTVKEGYLKARAEMRVFLRQGDIFRYTAPTWGQLRMLNRAVQHCHRDISRMDPVFVEVISLFMHALAARRPGSKRLREQMGLLLREAYEVFEPDHPLVSGLHNLRRTAWAHRRQGYRYRTAATAVPRLRDDIDKLRSRPDPNFDAAIISMLELAEKFGECGRYDEMVHIYDELVTALPERDLPRDVSNDLTLFIADRLYEIGETYRAAPLFESYYDRESRERRRDPNPKLRELITDTRLELKIGRCYLSSRQPISAETILSVALERLDRHLDKVLEPNIYNLRHNITYELGSAMLKQGKRGEAEVRFRRAHKLIAGPEWNNEDALCTYYNAVAYGRI